MIVVIYNRKISTRIVERAGWRNKGVEGRFGVEKIDNDAPAPRGWGPINGSRERQRWVPVL